MTKIMCQICPKITLMTLNFGEKISVQLSSQEKDGK